ncbi:MAG: hypothetical protein PHP37_02455 [Patescibacteria group bacterium]|nr:hypothetical protein [Patescibacteria group bacterium]
MSLKSFIKKRPHLFWYIGDLDNISEDFALEQVLNFGDFDDVKLLLKIIGINRASEIFDGQIRKKRCNYRPEVKNYFKLYFKEYASRSVK